MATNMIATNDTQTSEESYDPYVLLPERTTNLHPLIFKHQKGLITITS
jgi:hypothetical protein